MSCEPSPCPSNPRLDLRVDERDHAGTAPKDRESGELLSDMHFEPVLGFVVGDW